MVSSQQFGGCVASLERYEMKLQVRRLYSLVMTILLLSTATVTFAQIIPPCQQYIIPVTERNKAGLPEKNARHWSEEKKKEWLKENENTKIAQAINLLTPYLIYAKHVTNDTVLINLLYDYGETRKDLKGILPFGYKESEEKKQWNLIDRIQSPQIRDAALTVPNLINYKRMRKSLFELKDTEALRYLALSNQRALNQLSDNEDLIFVHENTNDQSIKYATVRMLAGNFHPDFIWKRMKEMPYSLGFLLFLIVVSAIATSDIYGLGALFFPLPHFIFVMIDWRINAGTVWPGFIGYFFVPWLGLLAPFAVYYGISTVQDFLEDYLDGILERAASIITNLLAAIVCFAGGLFVDWVVFSNGLSISSSSMPTGNHYLSDEVLASESLTGYLMYFAVASEILLFLLGACYILWIFLPFEKMLVPVIEKNLDN